MKNWMSADVWKADYEEFSRVTSQFYKKEISMKDYKGFSGGFGSYAQRGGEASMLRLRLPGGCLDLERLRFIADGIQKYGIAKAHLTTCQNVQLHNLSETAVCSLAVEALDAGIVTRGAGGDFPRNVMVSPLSGVEQGEYFDVMPYAKKASEYLMSFIKGPKLPRKLKVGFSNSPDNVTHATYRDLGFVARENGAFDVYSAGGLGNNPKTGVKVAEQVDPLDILYYIKAMQETFLAYGNYENRGKARTRYMQESLGGPENYRQAYLEKLEQVRQSGEELRLNPEEVAEMQMSGDQMSGKQPTREQPTGEQLLQEFLQRSGPETKKRVIWQKQKGLYAVHYHPLGGDIAPEMFGKLYELLKEEKGVEIRLSPDESLYLINCTAETAKKALELTKDSGKTDFACSVACIGASICQAGVRDSQALLRQLADMEQEEGFADGILPTIHISGCPSSCGTHQTGVIGFHGGVKMVEKTPYPAFTLHYNGREREGSERFGETLGVMLEKDIPEFLRQLGRTVQQSGQTFEAWREQNPDGVKELAEGYLK